MIKVTAPMYAKEVENTLKLINEKKEYFIKVSDDINEGRNVEEGEKKDADEGNTGNEEKQEKKEKSKKEKINLDDEDMFPTIEN